MNIYQNHRVTGLAILVCLALGSTACGASEVGESCDEPGNLDECVDNAICTNEDGRSTCRLRCDEGSDCPAQHKCNGVSGTDIKSCQPDKDIK